MQGKWCAASLGVAENDTLTTTFLPVLIIYINARGRGGVKWDYIYKCEGEGGRGL